jgi:hypothetical protein
MKTEFDEMLGNAIPAPPDRPFPFLGALATARKDDATLSQKFWISLAGPLPGLSLGIALLMIATRNHIDCFKHFQ